MTIPRAYVRQIIAGAGKPRDKDATQPSVMKVEYVCMVDDKPMGYYKDETRAQAWCDGWNDAAGQVGGG